MAVLGRYTKDDVLYRGEIVDVGERSVEIFYVDYGNREHLPFHRIYKMPQECQEIPIKRIRCSLIGISPANNVNWDYLPHEGGLPPFVREGQQKLEVQKREARDWLVTVTCPCGSLNEYLVLQGLAVFTKIKHEGEVKFYIFIKLINDEMFIDQNVQSLY